MDVIEAKILAGFLFFFLAMFFGWMPFWCYRRCTSKTEGSKAGLVMNRPRKQSPIVQYLHSMAAGVLIATCLLSLLPESLEAVRVALEARQRSPWRLKDSSEIPIPTDVANSSDSDFTLQNIDNISSSDDTEAGDSSVYPIAECLVALGFIFIYMIDSIIKSFQSDAATHPNSTDDKVIFQRSRVDNLTQHTAESAHFGDSPETVKWNRPSLSEKHYEPLRQYDHEHQDNMHENANGELHGSSSSKGADSDRRLSTISASGSESDSKDFLLHDMNDQTPETRGSQRPVRSNQLRSLALVAALCIHGFFDGVMLGLQTSQSVILSLLFALSLHKSFVAIGLSLTLMSTNENNTNKYPLYVLSYIFLFALVAPLGLLLSAAFVHKSFVTADGQSVGIGAGCLQAFAVGTFMYVTFTETTERHHQRRRLGTEILSHVFLLTGFGLMAGLRAAIGDA